MSMRKDLACGAVLSNITTYQSYIDRIFELATSQFDWSDLPDTVSERYLETLLYYRGSCAFIHDPQLGYLVLPYVSFGRLDVYGNPTRILVYTPSGTEPDQLEYNADNEGYSLEIDMTDPESRAVIIYNNYSHTPAYPTCVQYAQRLTNIKRTQDINLNAQKVAVLIKTPENKKRTMLELYRKVDNNEPAIFADDNFDSESYTVLHTDAPYLYDRLASAESQEWANLLTYLGIDNINFTKRERLLTDEVEKSQGTVSASRWSRLECRRQAVEHILKVFPELDITVEVREPEQTEPAEGDQIEEGADNNE